MLRDGNDFEEELLSQIPDELYEWIAEVKQKLQSQFDQIVAKHQKILDDIKEKNISSRKEFALQVIENCKENNAKPWLVFSLDTEHKNYHERLWKTLKPEHETYR